MRRIFWLMAVSVLALSAAPVAAGPSAAGLSSDNVEYVSTVPLETGLPTGARLVGSYLYVAGAKSFSIYDVSDPLAPERLSTVPFGFEFENEDVDTNGKIMLFSEQLPVNRLHVWDVEDKTNPVEIGTLPGAGNHTATCISNCRYAYGSSGAVVDLEDPTNPELIGNWGEDLPSQGSHDVTEVAPGIVLTSSRPVMLLDTRQDPVHPRLLAAGDDDAITGGVHSNIWPRRGKDRFFLLSSESNFTGRCSGANGAFMVWDAKGYKRSKSFKLSDIYQLSNGTYTDGAPPATASGCSSHWFEAHPDFRNGGLVALGSYDHGTRFIEVSAEGKIEEVGYFVPYGGQTSAAYWLTDEIVYAVDVTRGVDILRFKGDASGEVRR
ncbi:MAG: hypothetical protein M3217_05420 [Actinomycetota bacterium]|nr:hypothetical protein [Actinomycetota bacterium]